MDKWRNVKEEKRGGRTGSEEGRLLRQKALSEVLLEEVQQCNLIMLSRLWTSDAVSFVGVNLEKTETTNKHFKAAASSNVPVSSLNSAQV